jgi:hypothetical protein
MLTSPVQLSRPLQAAICQVKQEMDAVRKLERHLWKYWISKNSMRRRAPEHLFENGELV